MAAKKTKQAPKGAETASGRKPRTKATTATKGARRGRKVKPAEEPQDAAPADTGADTAPPTPAGGDLTLAELREAYLAHLEEIGKSNGTIFGYGMDLALAVRHLGESTRVASLTARKVQNFYESDVVTKTRTGKAKAQPTIAKTRRVLRLALQWAAEQGLIAAAPLPAKYVPRHKSAAEVATTD